MHATQHASAHFRRLDPLSTPIIMDIEASGFGAQSYPIEVGLALPDNQRYCALIKPLGQWEFWDDTAEHVHHISREMLAHRGQPVTEIALELNRLLDGNTVFSDGWVVDEPWLIRLFHAAGVARRFAFYDLQTVLSEAQMSLWHATKYQVEAELNLSRHRASNDARVIQETYLRTRTLTMAAS